MKKLLLGGLAAVFIAMLSEPAMAQQLNSSGVMNDVLQRFHNAASTWGPAIEAAASRLFWALVVISMVWTFGMMALRKADIGEFFAEFVRFTIFTGFFWWLLTNATTGMNIAGTIVQSMQQLGAQAGGLGDSRLGPSAIVDIGFELYDRTVEATSELGWRRMGTAIVMELMALGVLLVLALIAVNLLLLLASSWVLLYAGIFFLGFGGSRWTSDIAINYYKTVLGIAAQILAMVLIVAIGKQFLTHYYSQISGNMAAQELAVMLVVAVCLLFLVNRIPPLISGIVSGGGIGAAGGIGNFGASSIAAAGGAAIGAAAAVGSAVATGGAALAAGAASIGGGASAIKAAFEKAQGYAANDAGSMPMFGGGSDSGSDAGSFAQAAGFGGGSGSGAGTTTPLAQAAGFGSSSGSGASGSGGRNGQQSGKSDGGSSSKGSEGGGSKASAGGDAGGTKSDQGARSLIAATAANLAQGIGDVAKAKAASIRDAAVERMADTTGGKIAAAIRASSQNDQAAEGMPTFGGDSLAGADSAASDPESEVAAFANRDHGKSEA